MQLFTFRVYKLMFRSWILQLGVSMAPPPEHKSGPVQGKEYSPSL
ncbi:MAG: hypothetical protein ACJAZB_000417 [Psychrosphaera sp.]|jgi:hypothetical protein